MRFYDCISKYRSATEDTHHISGLEWNYSQLIAGAAEGRGTGTNYSKLSSTDAWMAVSLARPAGDYSPTPLHSVQR